MPMPPDRPDQTPTYATLRKRFKELQAQTNNVFQHWQIRVHRSLSWLKRSEELPADQADLRFITCWIALNALYGRWDAVQNRPAADEQSRRQFVSRLVELDRDEIGAFLRSHKRLLKPVLGNEYLSRSFWGNPDHSDARRLAVQDGYKLDGLLSRREYERLLGIVLHRLYVLRGQVMHGAATVGSRLNRKTINDCLSLMQALVPRVLHIVLERACNDDWPEPCYPPMDS